MNRDQILRRHDEITAETDAVIRRGKEIVAKLESGAIKPEDPQVKEVLQQLIERRRIGTEFNAELSRLQMNNIIIHTLNAEEFAYTPRCPSRQFGRLGSLLVADFSTAKNGKAVRGIPRTNPDVDWLLNTGNSRL